MAGTELLMKNKVAVITGASRGIGMVISERLASQGAHLALTARSESNLIKVAESCKRLGAASTRIYPCDLRSPPSIESFAKKVLNDHGGVNCLINNAGIMPKRDGTADGDLNSWLSALVVNVYAPMALTNFFVPSLVAQKDGLIVNIASIAGVDPQHDTPVYAATKFALRGYSHSCYEALRSKNVKVVCINPGPVDTDMATGRFVPDRTLLPGDVADAVMLAIQTSSRCIPQDVTLRLAQFPEITDDTFYGV